MVCVLVCVVYLCESADETVCSVCLVPPFLYPPCGPTLGVRCTVDRLAGVGVYDVIGPGRVDGVHGVLVCGWCGVGHGDAWHESILSVWLVWCKCFLWF